MSAQTTIFNIYKTIAMSFTLKIQKLPGIKFYTLYLQSQPLSHPLKISESKRQKPMQERNYDVGRLVD